MSVYKVLLLAGAAAFVSSAALAGGNVAFRASDVVGFKGVPANKEVAKEPSGTGKCGTSFGAEPTTPNGIIAWNDTSGTGYNNASGADFTCAKTTSIKKVEVYGYDAPHNPELYNVTFYKADPNDPDQEANDAAVVCSYTSVSGAGGGSYPTRVLTKLKLNPKCKLKKGHYWVSVQDFDASGPWYHEVTTTLQGIQADWIDRNNQFGSGCTTFDNQEYLVNCLGYTYPDWMLELK